MRTLFTRWSAGLMLIVFTFGTMPPEYLHDIFVHHQDDTDPVLKHGHFAITRGHHHCSFMGFTVTPFVATEPGHLFFEHISYSNTWVIAFYNQQFSASRRLVSLRGPPATGNIPA